MNSSGEEPMDGSTKENPLANEEPVVAEDESCIICSESTDGTIQKENPLANEEPVVAEDESCIICSESTDGTIQKENPLANEEPVVAEDESCIICSESTDGKIQKENPLVNEEPVVDSPAVDTSCIICAESTEGSIVSMSLPCGHRTCRNCLHTLVGPTSLTENSEAGINNRSKICQACNQHIKMMVIKSDMGIFNNLMKLSELEAKPKSKNDKEEKTPKKAKTVDEKARNQDAESQSIKSDVEVSPALRNLPAECNKIKKTENTPKKHETREVGLDKEKIEKKVEIKAKSNKGEEPITLEETINLREKSQENIEKSKKTETIKTKASSEKPEECPPCWKKKFEEWKRAEAANKKRKMKQNQDMAIVMTGVGVAFLFCIGVYFFVSSLLSDPTFKKEIEAVFKDECEKIIDRPFVELFDQQMNDKIMKMDEEMRITHRKQRMMYLDVFGHVIDNSEVNSSDSAPENVLQKDENGEDEISMTVDKERRQNNMDEQNIDNLVDYLKESRTDKEVFVEKETKFDNLDQNKMDIDKESQYKSDELGTDNLDEGLTESRTDKEESVDKETKFDNLDQNKIDIDNERLNIADELEIENPHVGLKESRTDKEESVDKETKFVKMDQNKILVKKYGNPKRQQTKQNQLHNKPFQTHENKPHRNDHTNIPYEEDRKARNERSARNQQNHLAKNIPNEQETGIFINVLKERRTVENESVEKENKFDKLGQIKINDNKEAHTNIQETKQQLYNEHSQQSRIVYSGRYQAHGNKARRINYKYMRYEAARRARKEGIAGYQRHYQDKVEPFDKETKLVKLYKINIYANKDAHTKKQERKQKKLNTSDELEREIFDNVLQESRTDNDEYVEKENKFAHIYKYELKSKSLLDGELEFVIKFIRLNIVDQFYNRLIASTSIKNITPDKMEEYPLINTVYKKLTQKCYENGFDDPYNVDIRYSNEPEVQLIFEITPTVSKKNKESWHALHMVVFEDESIGYVKIPSGNWLAAKTILSYAENIDEVIDFEVMQPCMTKTFLHNGEEIIRYLPELNRY